MDHRTATVNRGVARALTVAALALLACVRTQARPREAERSTQAEPVEGAATVAAPEPQQSAGQQALEALLGHPLQIEVDPAVVTQFGPGLHTALPAALEAAAGGLEQCRHRYAAAFSFAVGVLQLLRFQPASVSSAASPDLDTSTGTLSVPVALQTRTLLDTDLCAAFGRAFQRDARSRYAALAPADVPAPEQQAYLDYLDWRSPGATKDIVTLLGDELSRGQRVLELYPLVRDPLVQKEVVSALVRLGRTLRRAYLEPPPESLRSELSETRAAWIRWVNAHTTELDEWGRTELAYLLLLHDSAELSEFSAGFDTVAFGLPVVERWVREGSQLNTSGQPLISLVVCRFRRWASDAGMMRCPPGCSGAVFVDLARRPGGLQELAESLLRLQSAALTETALLHVLEQLGAVRAAELLDALAPSGEQARAGVRALADYDWDDSRPRSRGPAPNPKPLLSRVARWSREYPSLRPALLGVVAQVGTQRLSPREWPRLARYLGAPVDGAQLSAFLAETPRALWTIPALGPALSRGWSRTKVISPPLQAWLNSRDAVGDAPDDLVDGILQMLCNAGTAGDVAALRRALRDHDELQGTQLSQLPAARCPRPRDYARTGRDSPTRSRELLFGD